MDLLIMGLLDSMAYEPTNRTYAIRIDSSFSPFGEGFNLQVSSLYTIVQYCFDDRSPRRGYGKLFDVKMARKLLTDFKERGLGQDTLLVHCTRGRNRSPAVGIALNEIFKLGHDGEALKKQYPQSTWFVYDTLIETARKVLS